jgi:ribosomal protein S18 acetylase RimI-like enzyme
MAQVRWAHRGEAPKVYPLFRALVEAEQAEPPRPSAFSRTWGASFREGSAFRFAVAEGDARRIVGCVSLHQHFSTWKGAPVISLEDFFVLPEERGKGVGGAMLAFAAEHARALGAARIELDVRRDNARAQALYQRNGFVEQPYLWYHKPIDAGAPPAKEASREKSTRRPGRPRGKFPHRGPGRPGKP